MINFTFKSLYSQAIETMSLNKKKNIFKTQGRNLKDRKMKCEHERAFSMNNHHCSHLSLSLSKTRLLTLFRLC